MSSSTPVSSPTIMVELTQVPDEASAPIPTNTPLPLPIGTPMPTPDPRIDVLKQKALEWGDAMSNHDWETVYSTQTADFQSKCPLSTFIPYFNLINAYSPDGIPKGAEYVLDDFKVEGDLAWVYSHFEVNGVPIYHDGDEYDENEPPENIWVGDRWEYYTPDSQAGQGETAEQLCDLQQFAGLVVEVPAQVGSILQVPNGANITVTNIVSNAWPLIQRNSEYSDPPQPGARYYMITTQVTYPSGLGSISVARRHFKLVGSDRVTYDTYGSSCGSWGVPNELAGEIYAGGSIQGNICFEVRAEESGFILIYHPSDVDYPMFLSVE